MLLELGVFMAGLALLLLAIFAVPTLLQIRRTARNVEYTAKTLNQNLPGILTSLDEITTNLASSSMSLRGQIESVRVAVDKIVGIADDVVDFERNLRQTIEEPLVDTLTTFAAVVKGIRVFLDVFRSRTS